MARAYAQDTFLQDREVRSHNIVVLSIGTSLGLLAALALNINEGLHPFFHWLLGVIVPGGAIAAMLLLLGQQRWIEQEREKESDRRGGKPVLGLPPQRDAFQKVLEETRARGKRMIDRYLVGFEVENGAPMWVEDGDLCSHGCVFAKTGVGKTLWLEGLMFQQMARGRASGFTFIDAKRDPGTLADIIIMALITGRIDDLIVIDPFDPVCSYNFVFTSQRPDVKARKILRCGLPPVADNSPTKHYDRLASDAVYRVVRAMETFGLAWSVKDVAVALSAFQLAYPRLREILYQRNETQAMIELGHLAGSYRSAKGQLDPAKITENLRGIAAELQSISNSEAGEMFCAPRADLSLTDAILRGKLIYYMLPRLEEAESAERMVKVFREDLEVSIGEITSSRTRHLEDPHMVIIDEGASTFGPTWANLFELARKGRFALLFGAQSISGLMDQQMGLSEEFYQRVIANVNLKVIMRLGDNKTAEDMSEWIGKVITSKTSLGVGLSAAYSAHELTKNLEFNRRSMDGVRQAITMSEDQTELVSTEELKHEMSFEKGLAWFDLGDGRIRKGRSIWFNAELPPTWEGREHLVHYDAVEGDEVGLAEWVDEHVLSLERQDQERDGSKESRPTTDSAGKSPDRSPGQSSGSSAKSSSQESESSAGGRFRINLMRPQSAKSRIFVDTKDESVTEAAEPSPPPSPAVSAVPPPIPVKKGDKPQAVFSKPAKPELKTAPVEERSATLEQRPATPPAAKPSTSSATPVSQPAAPLPAPATKEITDKPPLPAVVTQTTGKSSKPKRGGLNFKKK
ncbi:MAG: TraM recognition domain-containing protein [bacterium]|nr:TraM recognition domain-containing protein [bacterium]